MNSPTLCISKQNVTFGPVSMNISKFVANISLNWFPNYIYMPTFPKKWHKDSECELQNVHSSELTIPVLYKRRYVPRIIWLICVETSKARSLSLLKMVIHIKIRAKLFGKLSSAIHLFWDFKTNEVEFKTKPYKYIYVSLYK